MRLGASFAFFVCFSWSAHGAAQSDALALAEALFQEGRALLEKGELAQACPKLAESYKLDPATGTLLNLAYCHEREGKLATAWAEFRTALSRVKRDGREERVKFARDSIARLEPKLPRVVLEVEAPPGEALRIELDGTELGRAAWGMPMPVDPGIRVIRATSPGRAPHEAQVTLVEGQTVTVQIPELVADDATKTSDAAPREPSRANAEGGSDVPREGGGARRTLTYALGGLGVVGIAAGSYFGVVAIRQERESDPDCDADGCKAEAHEKYEAAQHNAMLSNVGLGVGIVSLGVATYLYLTEPDEAGAAAQRARKSSARPSRDLEPKARFAALPSLGSEGAFLNLTSEF